MVKGLEIFAEHFKAHADKFVLIGGTACDIAMSQMGLNFRLTKDLDIVLIIEAMDAGFSECFWDFVKKGGYKKWENSSGEKKFYRFIEPQNRAFPDMLELFSRKPDIISIPSGCHLTPIPVEQECSSLSAILLNEDYYAFILSGATPVDGIQILLQEHLIPLKAKAYLDLSQRQAAGQRVDSKEIGKHKKDIFRLFQLLTPESSVQLPASIADDFKQFLDLMVQSPPDLKSLGIRTDAFEVVARLRTIYNR
jgi:hypothetical protein